ncbi:helix-turn-helix domain-containing protein [Gudongella sp. SC589]|uniref:helix-turn-helix domain-containing protein n=1 Tax=Gudongella sp. SC589 TaxID=3385990 RepID=UPI0039046801
MNLLDNIDKYDKQRFDWGEILWLHEPIESPYLRISVAQIIIYPGSRQEKHFHLGEEQLFFVQSGKGCFFSDGIEEEINPTKIIYVKPFSEHEVVNTGDENLVLHAVYVPIKLIQLERHSSLPVDSNIQDIIPLEILESIEDQLSDLLKMDIYIIDRDYTRLIENKCENEFCQLCLSVNKCSMSQYGFEGSGQRLDTVYRCNYNLFELKASITVNENILGYIRSERFVLDDFDKNRENLLDFSRVIDMDLDSVFETYKKVPYIIKSRTYVIHEHLAIAAEFIQEMLHRSIMEKELIDKDNEILTSTIEKIQLKDALKKANHRIYNDRIFTSNSRARNDIAYPYELEILLEEAIQKLDKDGIGKLIKEFSKKYPFSKGIVSEMIVVLSRTALRPLQNVELTVKLRKRYERYLQGEVKEDPWEVLKEFSLECVEEYIAISQTNGSSLIENINLFIKSHYREDLSLNLVAERFFISPNYLSSLFNEKNGVSFSEYIHTLRIDEAKLHLKNLNIKVHEISSRVGYKNNSYFSSIFKRYVGVTPNEYRRSLAKDN